jgi:hypothetical protein
MSQQVANGVNNKGQLKIAQTFLPEEEVCGQFYHLGHNKPFS